VFCCSFIPGKIRFMLCQIAFAAEQKREPQRALQQLIGLYDSLASYIDGSAIQYEGGIHPKHRLTGYHHFFVDRIVAGAEVIDVGCGIGAVAYSMACSGARVTAIDIDRKDIDKAKKKFDHKNLKFVCGDVRNIPPHQQYDIAVLSNVLEHIDDRIALLKALAVQIQSGILLIRVPLINSHWLVPMKKELGLPYFSDSSHYTEYTVNSFKEEIKESGLAIKYLQINWGEIWAEVTTCADGSDNITSS